MVVLHGMSASCYAEPMVYSLTPPPIKKLILLILTATFCIGLLDAFFDLIGWGTIVSDALSLSRKGLTSWHLWQPITALFFYSTDNQPVTFNFLILLFLQMALLWSLGKELFEEIPLYSLAWFFISIGAVTGLLTTVMTTRTISGSWPSILGYLTVWTLLFPEREVLGYLQIQIKAKWLTCLLIASILLIAATQMDGVIFFTTLFSPILAATYALFAWNLYIPNPQLQQQQERLLRYAAFIKAPKKSAAKVVDIKTGQHRLDDDAFVDAMLSKISKKGEKSLSWNEKKRLDEISSQRPRSP